MLKALSQEMRQGNPDLQGRGMISMCENFAERLITVAVRAP